MKKTVCCTILIVGILLMILTLPGFAATSGESNLEKAVDLKILGLFNGTDKGFELERIPSRVEGAAMLLRLLGKEQEAKDLNLSHPFTDVPSWADSLIGYMYRNGLTAGTGTTTFGSAEQLTARQYVTFVLRALGYNDKNNDFKYENALDKAVQIKLLSSSESASLKTTAILRNNLAGISYNALKTKLKASSDTLLDKLASQDKVISKVAATTLGLYTSDLQSEYGNVASYKPVSTTNGYVAKNSTDLLNILKKSFYSNDTQIKIDISSYNADAMKDFKALYQRAADAVSRVTGVKEFISSWKYVSSSSTLTLTIGYRYTKSEFQTASQHMADTLYKARHVVSGFIKQGMSDYDKDLLIHNYIVNNTKYDFANYQTGNIPDDSFSAYGCLILGKAVCQGYSEAFKLMSDLSALECIVVKGESQTASRWEGHTWNIVKVAGKYYHVDSTFDDPITDDGKDVLTYYYFNLSDKDLSKRHHWNASEYPVCNSLESNYYYKNDLVVSGLAEFKGAINEALDQRETSIELKVKDYKEDLYSNPSDIVFKSGSVSGFKYSSNDYFGIVSITDIKYR